MTASAEHEQHDDGDEVAQVLADRRVISRSPPRARSRSTSAKPSASISRWARRAARRAMLAGRRAARPGSQPRRRPGRSRRPRPAERRRGLLLRRRADRRPRGSAAPGVSHGTSGRNGGLRRVRRAAGIAPRIGNGVRPTSSSGRAGGRVGRDRDRCSCRRPPSTRMYWPLRVAGAALAGDRRRGRSRSPRRRGRPARADSRRRRLDRVAATTGSRPR